jgi:polar amino acid transport system substrate-binding protein
MRRTMLTIIFCGLIVFTLFTAGCGPKESSTGSQQIGNMIFAVPKGTVADKLVLSKYPQAKFQYFKSALDAAMAVKAGKADAVAYDEPILKNIAAKYEGLTVLSEMITVDNYGFAVRLTNHDLKKNIDGVIAELKNKGTYAAMQQRWLPKSGKPAHMPDIPLAGTKGVLKLGTAAITEPFSFVDGSGKIVGFDIELAKYVAQKLGKKLEIVNMNFGSLIPALIAGKVDMIAACITITEERAKSVLFSEPYYKGGIAVLVRVPKRP